MGTIVKNNDIKRNSVLIKGNINNFFSSKRIPKDFLIISIVLIMVSNIIGLTHILVLNFFSV